jgi:Fe-S oxidoreductase
MKIELLAHHRRSHPPSLRERAIAYLPRYAAWAARMAPLANLGAMLARPLLGFTTRRRLPAWRGDFFDNRVRASAEGGEREVVLFVDTFSRWFEPENAHAAIRVLEAASYRVHVAAPAQHGRPLCCGRTFLSAGLVEEARAEAQRTLEALQPWLERNVPVVGLEPSCLFTFRDEMTVLLPGTAEIARNSFLFEEFVAREAEAGRFELPLKRQEGAALLHGHCHQKAFGAMPAVERVLRMVPGLQVQTVESSCCGMAGSFGYEAEHYDVSMKMGEASLLPAVRKAPAEALLVADGTSCRHQIADGTGRRAIHVARVLADAL